MVQRKSPEPAGASTMTPFVRQVHHSSRSKPKGVQKARAKHAMNRCPLGKNQADESLEANMLRKRYVHALVLINRTNNLKILRATRRSQELHISTAAGTAQQVRHVS